MLIPSSKIYAGLDIGTNKVRLVVGESMPNGSLKILGLGEADSHGIKKGEIVDSQKIQPYIKEALLMAEETSGVDIHQVYVSISGSPILGVSNEAVLFLDENNEKIGKTQIEELVKKAYPTELTDNQFVLHQFSSVYDLDGLSYKTPPLDISGKRLKARFHFIIGEKNVLKKRIHSLREISLATEELVFAPLAAAQLCLSSDQKNDGILLIDMGAGTTNYILYYQGNIIVSGSISLGGDHISNDIHLVTKIPLEQAEEVKCLEGELSTIDTNTLFQEIVVKNEDGIQVGLVKRELLKQVIKDRVDEIFMLLRKKLPEEYLNQTKAGIYLTGGTSQLRGVDQYAEQYLKLKCCSAGDLGKVKAYAEDPKLSTVIGLLCYAQLIAKKSKPAFAFKRYFRFILPYKR